MDVGSDHGPSGAERKLTDLVVGLDGSAASVAALRWAGARLGPDGRVHVVHVDGDDESGLGERWLPSEFDGPDGPQVELVVREGSVTEELLRLADEVDADAIVVGHHAADGHGPRLVGHVTAKLLRSAERPVVIVPLDWDPDRTDARPVAIGVGGRRGTEAALRWALSHPALVHHGLLLAHAYGPRSIFRAEGWLDVLAYHLDPTVLQEWVEEDLLELAEQLEAETGTDVEITVSVRRGRAGPRLVDAGASAGMLVVGRDDPPFLGNAAIAPYLRHAIVHAPCPVVVVPAPDR